MLKRRIFLFRRLAPRRLCVPTVLFLMLTAIYLILVKIILVKVVDQKLLFANSKERRYKLPGDYNCKRDPIFEKRLLNLLTKGDKILTILNVTHFLCYGTLWAALRQSKLFPWKTSVDFCLLNEDVSKYDELFFRRTFLRENFDIDYKSVEGYYEVTPKNKSINYPASLNLHLFEKRTDLHIARHVGLKFRILPDTSDAIDSFPLRLINQPLDKIQLNGFYFPAPREDFEIQKYHYKEDWWKEIKPKNCR